MVKSGFVVRCRPQTQHTQKHYNKEMTEASKEMILYSNEDEAPLSAIPYEATESKRGDLEIISVLAVKASQLFKNCCKPAVYVQKVWKIGLNTLHIEVIRRTPFGAFVDMQPFSVDGRLLADIIRCHNKGEEFIFYGKAIIFSADEVALILDFPAHERKIDTSCQLYNGRLFRRFGRTLDLHQKELEKLINRLQSSKK